jgi:small subunit ribosomal protein S9
MVIMAEKAEKPDKKSAATEKPKHEKERVKRLIEEKMEKIRQQELVKSEKAAGKEEAAAEEKKAEEEKPAAEKKAKPAKEPIKETEGGKATFKQKIKPLPTSVFVTGKRKRAVARAFFKPGKGKFKVNSIPIELAMPDMFRLKMMEPLLLMGDTWKRFDGNITVRGGGPAGQADAVRQAIARGLSELLGPEAKKTFLSYDRNLIVYDSRRTEPHKPPHSSWGPRRYKQRSKR